MAETQIPTQVDVSITQPPAEAKSAPKPRVPKGQALNKLYALPAPLRTFPLPSFVPHNPLSLFHILYVWASQTLNPQLSNFDPIYQAWFSPETRSVHVTDARSIRGLWEQGFYGKGSLSRSEPSWLNREKARRGDKARTTAEENTKRRRAERQQLKWERARKEREAIDQKLAEEAEVIELDAAEMIAEIINAELMEEKQPATTIGNSSGPKISLHEFTEEPLNVVVNGAPSSLVISSPTYPSPVGPMELLALPNSVSCTSYNTNQAFDDIWMPIPSHLAPVAAPLPKRFPSPVGPLELLSLPNSMVDSWLEASSIANEISGYDHPFSCEVSANSHIPAKLFVAPVGPLEILALPNSADSIPTDVESIDTLVEDTFSPDDARGIVQVEENLVAGLVEEATIEFDSSVQSIDGSAESDATIDANGSTSSAPPNGEPTTPKVKRQKSVRFSPTVEKNTFIQSEPPSPDRGTNVPVVVEEPLVIKQEEHTQLTLEEAFFLSYSLGALTILDPATNLPISNKDLFTLFRQTSHFPPLSKPSISPDDPFMLNYIVYHHYRSLGWVPRSGIKFSVDLMLYMRGPVFTHAEFGVIILPSYSDPYWSSTTSLQAYAKSKEQRTWAWMNCINRVISQVKKTLILAYVDIPKPMSAEEESKLGINEILQRYKVREFVMKRWVSNRSRK
ncbi:hypothetical protein BGZ60DRAFT_384537 [Tricladium varicosporioides]|nr:hypothetical protein BGZ60DRAFT_384537 [Hymenoscyphus varicosporioides]